MTQQHGRWVVMTSMDRRGCSVTVVIVALTIIAAIIVSISNVFGKVFNTLELREYYQCPPDEPHMRG